MGEDFRTTMNRVARDQVLSELRSGKHRQSFDEGKTADGRLSADVVAMESLGLHFPTSAFEAAPEATGMTNREWQRFLADVIDMGEQHKPFSEIADMIERTY